MAFSEYTNFKSEYHASVLEFCRVFLALRYSEYESSVKLRGHSITAWTRGGGEGVKKCMFLSTLRVEKLSTQEGRGGAKKWQNSVHVVVE